MNFQTPIVSDNAPKAIGPYSPGICINGLVFLSGQLPVNPETGKIEAKDIKGQTRQSLLNVKALLDAGELTFENVIKTTVFLADMQDFSEMNEVYSEYMKIPYPTRSCVQVAALPMNARVEIEVLCARGTITSAECGCCE
ncbi:MAG: RidA family protein [Paenibacillaceae bacterium]|nr:RidA family protein [Paenibacillaceae bacterium]